MKRISGAEIIRGSKPGRPSKGVRKRVSSRVPAPLYEMLQIMRTELKRNDTNDMVSAALLCYAALYEVYGVDLDSLLPPMPELMKTIRKLKGSDRQRVNGGPA